MALAFALVKGTPEAALALEISGAALVTTGGATVDGGLGMGALSTGSGAFGSATGPAFGSATELASAVPSLASVASEAGGGTAAALAAASPSPPLPPLPPLPTPLVLLLGDSL